MKKIALALALVLATVSGSAMAEWVKVDESDKLHSYVDPATIRKDGNFRRAWEMQDLKRRGTEGEMSRRFLVQYDCKEARYRFLSISLHSKPMAGGDTLFTDSTPDQWRYIPPETVSEEILKFACAK